MQVSEVRTFCYFIELVGIAAGRLAGPAVRVGTDGCNQVAPLDTDTRSVHEERTCADEKRCVWPGCDDQMADEGPKQR
jgi:hypothetical protein